MGLGLVKDIWDFWKMKLKLKKIKKIKFLVNFVKKIFINKFNHFCNVLNVKDIIIVNVSLLIKRMLILIGFVLIVKLIRNSNWSNNN